MTPHTGESWKRLQEVFHLAIEASSEEKDSLIARYESEFPGHSKELLSMLAVAKACHEFLESPPTIPEEAVQTLAMELKNGQVVSDFEILSKLGAGGFGTVYLAKQISLDRKVALKVSPHLGEEAQTMALMEHDHIVPVFSETLIPEMGVRLICMQYIAGKNLSEVLETPLAAPNRLETLQWVAELGLQLADALQHAHNQGILHLDIKPENILISDKNRVLLADFNISVRSQIQEGLVVLGGSAAYMSPEQQQAFTKRSPEAWKTLDCRSDIFSLGKVLGHVFKKSLGEKDEGSLLENLFLGILENCVNPDPARRFQSASELRAHIEGFLAKLSIYRHLPNPGLLTRFSLKNPLIALLLGVLIPQVIGSIINIAYNANRIVSHFSIEQKELFTKLCVLWNPIIYGVAILTLFVPMTRMYHYLVGTRPAATESPKTAEFRNRILHYPLRVAGTAGVCWLISSFFFPIVLDIKTGPLPWSVYGHFGVSFLISALNAIAYSALATQFVSLRALYPITLGLLPNQREIAHRELKGLLPKVRFFYLLASLVPLSGMFVLLFVGPGTGEAFAGSLYQIILSLLMILTFAGVIISHFATRQLETILRALTLS